MSEINNSLATVMYEREIGRPIIELFMEKHKNIPYNWRRRFELDGWHILFPIDITQSGNPNPNNFLVSEPKDKLVWISVRNATVSDNPIYWAYIFYLEAEYGNPAASQVFQRACEEEKVTLARILHGNIYTKTAKQIFELLFIQMIEYPRNSLYDSLKTCKYVRSWLTEDIFRIDKSKLPNFLKVGTDVTEYQISSILEAWNVIPIGLREKFLNNGWKVVLTNSRKWRLDEDGRHISGHITSDKRSIFVKSSYEKPNIILFHEFGHYLFYYSDDCYIDEFKKAYMAERDLYLRIYNDKYTYNSLEEYFAQVFAYYLENPKQIERTLNWSYYIINKIAEQYK